MSLSAAGVLSTPSAPTAACVGVYSNIVFSMNDSGTPTPLTATSSAQTITVTGPTITFSSTLPAGAVGAAYTGSVAASGALGTITYSLASGALPASGHLTLNTSTGAITGTPYAADAGTYTFTVKVTDQYGDTATSGTLSITIAAPTITFPASLAGATVGTAYSASVAATGALGTTTYVLASGSLPASNDLALNASTGAITGTPHAADVGTYPITVKVTDQYGDTATSGTLSIAITGPTLTFPASLAGAPVGTAYSASAAATGALGTTTYVLASGSLPASNDLVLNASTGAITGTPHAADVGTYPITVKVTDQYGDTATSGPLSITITAPTITFATPTATASVGVAYSSSAAATGSVGTTTYVLASGALPSSGHLVLNTSTGAITGTPYAADAGTSNFTVKVTDQYGDTATSGPLSITITAPTITFATPTATASVGVAYSSSAAATGPVGTTTYTLASGALPSSGHLVLNAGTGAIAGTPYAADAGTSTFTVKVTDQYGDTATSGPLSITITAPTITFATPTATASVGVAYSSSATATGPVGTTTYALTSGALPASGHLTLNTSTGAITGTPYAADAGMFTFTVKVTDQYNDTATSGPLSIKITAPIITLNSNLPAGTVGTAYAGSVTASGTVGTTTYILSGGALGASGHLTLNGSTGAITGTPYAADAGTSIFAVTVTDQYGDSAGPFTENLVINAAGAITFGAAPTGTATDGVLYSSAVTASGGAGALTYSLVSSGSSNLPSNFALNSSTGAVSGTPSNLSSFTFDVQAADAYGDTPATQSYTVTVSPGAASKLAFTTEPSSTGTAATPFGAVVQVEDVNGFLVTSSTVSVTITSTASGLTGTTTVSAVGGVATFTNLILDTSGAYTLTAASSGLASAISSGITIGAGTASKLAFTSGPPSGGTAGTPFAAVVQVQDAYGNLVTSSNASVTITSTVSGVTGTTTVSAVGGVATFSNLLLNTSGTYTLTAASSGLTSATSSNISIGAGLPSKVVFTSEPPSAGTAGTPFTAVVQIEDGNGNLVISSTASVTITSTAAGVTGTTTVSAVGGVASFTNLLLNTTGTYSLTAASSGVTSATSTSIVISAGLPSKLVFTTEPPAGGTAATPFSALVQVQDTYGNLVTSSIASVTITSTASGVTGTTTVSAVGGVATFSNLILNTSGTYTLTAASSGLTSGTSTNIVISAGAATKLVFTTEPPSGGTAGTPFSATVQVQDTNGNLVTTSNASVTIASTAAGVTGTTTVSAVGGVATFNNLLLNTTGTYTLTASSSGLTGATSTSIVIGAGAASKLVFTTEPPSSGTAATPFGAVVQVQDANGNLVTTSNASVTITSTASGVTGTTTVSAVGGVATFTNLILNTSGAYTLTAATSGVSSAISSGIMIGAGTATKLVFTTEPPTGGAAGAPFSATVQVQDANGNLVTSNNSASVTITSTASGVTGTTTVTAVGGVATFTNLILNTSGTYSLTAAASGLSSATSSNITIGAGIPSKVVFTSGPPSSGTAGTPFTAVVQIQDGNGNLVTGSTASVTITSTASGVTGTTTVAAVGGVATFSNLLLNTTGTYTLTAASSGLTSGNSTSILISPGTASKLVFTIEPPSGGTAGTPFGTVVQVEDANNNLVTSSNASVTITSTSAGVTGTTTVSAVGGVATFSNLILNTSGTYTLTAATSGLTSAASTSIVISAGAASKLVFTTEPPANVTNGTPFTAVVQVQDANNNLVTASNASVTITSTVSGVTGTTNVSAVGGVATFNNLIFNSSATYTLQAASAGLAGANSSNVTASNQLTIGQTVLPSADQGLPYSFTLTASGGSGGGYTFTTTGASTLSTYGLSLASNGTISGTPTGAGNTATFTAKVTDSANNTATQALQIPVYGGLGLPSPDPGSLPSTGLTNQTYSGSINGAGGTGTYQWSVNGTLVTGAGVSLGNGTLTATASGNTLYINGVPATVTPSGSPLTFSVTLTDTAANNVQITQTGYYIAISAPIAVSLPSPSTSVPGSAVVSQSYGGSITALNGVPPYTWTVNGNPTTGAGYSLGDNITAISTGGSTLSFSGSPTTATTIGPFTVMVVDSTQPTNTSASNSYSIVVNPAGYTVSGQISLADYCGSPSGFTLPTYTVSLYTSPGGTLVTSTTTDTNGNYSFAAIPNGTYTITPSISGPSSLFSPTTQTNVVVDNNTISGENFQATLGYTVSGTVSYGGSATGQIYVTLKNTSCGQSNGTSISAPGAFTIHGVMPGTYSMSARMDMVGYGAKNASDPLSSTGSLTLSNGNLSGQTVTLANPSAVTLSAAPTLSGSSGFADGVVLNYQPLTTTVNNKTVETATSYNVQWSTTTSFTSPAGSTSFPATGTNGAESWILNVANISGLTAPGPYYFRAQGVNGSSTSNWSSTVGPVTLAAPSAGNTVSGQVTWSGTATGPLYVVFFSPNVSQAYVAQVGSKAAPPTSPATYTVEVPSGTGFYFVSLLDQSNSGILIAPGDPSNFNNNTGPPTVNISGSATENTTLTTAGSLAIAPTTYYHDTSGSTVSTGYNLSLEINAGSLLPVAVTLESGPNVISPVDMGQCTDCGDSGEFDYSPNLNGGAPTVGDTYTFQVTYSNQTTASVTAQVTGWNNTSALVGASDLTTLISPAGSGNSDTPNFDWTYPATDTSGYIYKFWVCCSSSSNSNDIWDVPGNNAATNGFTSSQITPPLDWGVDPTDSGNTPSPSSLSAGGSYEWTMRTQDSYGNTAEAQMAFFTTPSSALSLPAADPSTLPAAVVSQTYNGAITATGGVQPYVYGISDSCFGCSEVSLSDGLGVTNGYGTSLTIGGTPTSVTSPGSPVSFQLWVKDATETTYGPVTYTIAVNSAGPLLLPSSGPGPALAGYPFTGSINASGGSGSGYSFTVNSTLITATSIGSAISFSGNDGLLAYSSGGTLYIVGTPTTAESSLPLNVTVTDSLSNTASQLYSLVVSSGPGTSGVNDALLYGTYICKFDGYDDSDGSRWSSLSSFVANGSGGINSGAWDTNGRDFPAEMSGTISSTSSYSVGSDNMGVMTINSVLTSGGSGTHTSTSAIALNDANGATSTATEFRMVEIDDVGTNPSGQHGAGVCYQATTSAFASSTLSGYSFAFGVQGELMSGLFTGNPYAEVGRFTAGTESSTGGTGGAAGGGITAGVMDGTYLSSQLGDVETTFIGSYTAPSTTTGRFTLSGIGSQNFVAYIIDANRMFMLSTNSSNELLAGDMRTQQQSANTASALLSGSYVFYGHAFEGNSTGSVTGYDSFVYQVSGTGTGTSTINASFDDDDGTFTAGKENGPGGAPTFDSSNPGRATAACGNDSCFFYFFNAGSAFFLDLNGSNYYLETGWLEAQTQPSSPPFANANVAGSYLSGELPRESSGANDNIGEITLNSSGGMTGSNTLASAGSLQWDQPSSAMGATGYSWLSTTYGSLSGTIDSTAFESCIDVTPVKSGATGKIVCIENTSQGANVDILEQ
jgi:hypothetical protein